MIKGRSSSLLLAAIFVAVVASSHIAARSVLSYMALGPGTAPGDTAVTLVRNEASHGSPSASAQLVLVFVGGTECAYSVAGGVRDAVRAAEQALREEAQDRNVSFASVGIANDASPGTGIAYLNEIAGFDEVVSGFGWTQRGIGKLVRDLLPGPLTTPQLIVIERNADSSSDDDSVNLRYRITGLDRLQWFALLPRVPKLLQASNTQ